jgi:hypothetical protein
MIQTSLFDRTDSLSRDIRSRLNGKLAGYLAASGAMAAASQSEAAVIGNTTEQLFGINEEVAIDFNSDGQIDFEIDHDRVVLTGGSVLDYLQVDKNDTNGASVGENPLPINVFDAFDLNGTPQFNSTFEAAYVVPAGTLGEYPAALTLGTSIGPASSFDFQEGDNFSGTTIRANRLIDEDAGQIDQELGGLTPAQVHVPTNGANFLGLGGDVAYLGVKMQFQGAGPVNYGWIGIRIDNEADATGAVVGYAYENTGGRIPAGQVPEPTTFIAAGLGAAALLGGRLFGRRGRRVEK